MIPASRWKSRIDVAIITVKSEEFRAVLDRFPDRETLSGARNYDFATVRSVDGGVYSVAITCTLEQGESEAQKVTTSLISDLDPRHIFLVGIAGGVPKPEFSLGDVILATRVNAFVLSALGTGGETTYQVTGGAMSEEVKPILAHLEAWKEKRLDGWNTPASIRCARPIVEVPNDNLDPRLYGPDEWRSDVIRSLGRNHPPDGRNPVFVAAPVAAGNLLVKNVELVQQWQESARQLSAVEMELEGVYSAARTKGKEYPVFSIRGLSDIIGYRREPEWTEYACHTAGAFAYHLFRAGVLSRRDPDIGEDQPDAGPPRFARPELMRRIQTCLERYGTCVLFGPHGFGKTILAEMVRDADPGPAKAEVRHDCWDLQGSYDFILADDVKPDHRSVQQGIFRAVSARKVLFTTRNRQLAAALCGQRLAANCTDAVIEVGGLEEQEGIEFLDRLVGQRMTFERKARLVRAVCGSMFFLNMAPELADQLDDFGEVIRADCDDAESRPIITRWLSEIAIPGPARLALRALCRLSEIGMSPQTLAHIVNTTEVQVADGLRPLFERQYIRRRRDHAVGSDHEFWVPHDLLRNYFDVDMRGDDDKECESRFDAFTCKAVQEGRIADLGLITMLDIFTVQIRNIFRALWETSDDTSLRVDFLSNLRARTSFLQEIMEASPTGAQAERLAVLFRDRLRPEATYCKVVIPIAMCLGNLSPLESIAETAWLGARQEDDWARACSIWAASNHWRYLDETVRVRAIERLRAQLDIELRLLYEHWSKFDRGYDKSPPSDMSLACIFGGLAALGQSELVSETVSRSRYQTAVRFSILAELTGVVCLLDAGQRANAVKLWARVRDRSSGEQATHLVHAYAQSQGISLSRPFIRPEKGVPSFNRNVAAAAQSDKFLKFIRENDPTAFPYISGVL